MKKKLNNIKDFITTFCASNKNFIIICFLSALNLWVMHQFFVINGFLEDKLFIYSYVVNTCTLLVDIPIILCLFLIVTFGRLKWSTYATYIFTLIWSFVNVFYGRFFFQYLSISAIFQAEGLTDDVVIKSMLAGFQWFDIYYLASLFLFLYTILRKKIKAVKLSWRKILLTISIPFISMCLVFIIYSTYHFAKNDTRGNLKLYKLRLSELIFNPTEARNAYPNNVEYHAGVVRCLASELIEILLPYELTKEQRQSIEKAYFPDNQRTTTHEVNPKIKNVVFLLLESFMSVTSDLVVKGKRITPFLDSLKHTDDVYYNGNVHPNITIGESGDGQFIYMTGILPLRAKYTVGEAKHNTLPYALPRLLQNKMNIVHTEIVVPSSLGVWQQEKMNIAYNLKDCYSKSMVQGNQGEDLTDESVFDLAMRTSKTKNQPFFSMVLSISTHQPYREIVDPNFTIEDNSLPQGYKYYLNACHFADLQIEKYIDHLKQEGLYDNSLIIITSDHHAHLDALDMEGKISTDLPLYIINGNIDKSQSYDGPCNQLDVYTTILDILNINCKWRGLGHTLLLPNYTNSVDDKAYDLSEMIIMGDYFKLLPNS